MIGRFVLAALVAGLAAGFLTGVIQEYRITPLILQAEVYEKAADTKTTTQATAPAEPAEWQPQNGWQRGVSTLTASMIACAGYAGLLAGVSLLTGIEITPRNGLIWGILGFLAVAVAPGAGLSPELPGMPAGDLMLRQIWWTGTILATVIGIYIIAEKRKLPWLAVAVLLIALPHLIGAPQPPTLEASAPAGLAASFVSISIATAAVMWSMIGLFLGLALEKFGKGIYNT